MGSIFNRIIFSVLLISLAGCASLPEVYRDPNMDFGAIRTIAVLPFANLSRESSGADRVRDVFANALLATGAVYVLPSGEVARGLSRAGIVNPTAPAPEEVVKLAGVIKADAVITGVVKEYGEVRSGSTEANVISLSLQMMEAQTGKIIWSASTTKGGIGLNERLLGGGGEPMNKITEQAVNELIDKLL